MAVGIAAERFAPRARCRWPQTTVRDIKLSGTPACEENPAMDSRRTKTESWTDETRPSLASPLRLLGITPDSRRSDAISFEASIATAVTTRETTAAMLVARLKEGWTSYSPCTCTTACARRCAKVALGFLPWAVSQGDKLRYRVRTPTPTVWVTVPAGQLAKRQYTLHTTAQRLLGHYIQ